jgi:hypothetical protein
MSVPSYVDVVDEGQGGHQRHSSSAVGVTAAHKGPCGGKGDRPQERYGTTSAREDRRGGLKRRACKRWRGKKEYRDHGEQRARRELRDGRLPRGGVPRPRQILGGG